MSFLSLKSDQGLLLLAGAASLVFFVPTSWLLLAGLVSVIALMVFSIARFVFGSWS